jgi:sugar lactone lactonase YvrE
MRGRIDPAAARSRGSAAVQVFLGFACLCCSLLTGPACRKERTYSAEVRGGARYVHNLKPAYERPAAGLAFVRKIGELESKGADYLFAQPISAGEDEQGNLYVLDMKDHCVKKFGADRKFLLKFGRAGQGPGEFAYPMSVLVGRKGCVAVATMTSEIHVFDDEGGFIDRVHLPPYRGISPAILGADRVVAYAFQSRGENSRENHVLAIFDLEGRIQREFGEPYLLDTAMRTWNANFLSLTVDGEENIFVAFSSLNRIEKYSAAGELLLSIDRALPFEVAHRYRKSTMDIGGRSATIDEPDFTPVNRGIGIDGRGRIWVLSVQKGIVPSEMPKETRFQDHLAFEVYDGEGVLLFRVPFPAEVLRFDNMTMHADHVFFVDPIDQACVYEFAVVDRDK